MPNDQMTTQAIAASIHIIRGQKVMLDTDLAEIYGIQTFRLNEAVKRHRGRFPKDFMFQLTVSEASALTSQIAMSKKGRGGRRTRPYAFTEHGAIMVANILNSERAVKMSVFVVRAFVRMRSVLSERQDLANQLKALEQKLTKRLNTHEMAIVDVLRRLMVLLEPPPEPSEPLEPKRRIGFHP
jgi:phage regulator Rha-like protein